MKNNMRRLGTVLCGAIATVLANTPATAEAANLVLRNGKVITLDHADRVTEAIAVQGNRILAAGTNAEILRLTGPRTHVVDLHGRSVTPGFIDAHTHSEHTAGSKGVLVGRAQPTSTKY
jgi:predicted amidohydrolase YtcJ